MRLRHRLQALREGDLEFLDHPHGSVFKSLSASVKALPESEATYYRDTLAWSGRSETRAFLLFVIDLATRRVEIAGIVHQPHGAWMKQVARNLTDAVDGFLLKHRHIILDRDPLYTRAFRKMLRASGVRSVRLPPRSPNLNAYAERFIGSVRRECLDRVVPLGERHLRQLLHEYVDHYHTERNHQGLGNKLITAAADAPAAPSGRVLRRKRLGGVLNHYFRDAA